MEIIVNVDFVSLLEFIALWPLYRQGKKGTPDEKGEEEKNAPK